MLVVDCPLCATPVPLDPEDDEPGLPRAAPSASEVAADEASRSPMPLAA